MLDTHILELGCGISPHPRATVFHDRTLHSPHIQVAHDLNVLLWPWSDASFDGLISIDVMEHLKIDIADWLDECWRILKPFGTFILQVPHYKSENAYTDPTHHRFFTPKTFDYWDKSKEYHHKYGCYYFAEKSRWWKILACEVRDNITWLLQKEVA